MKKHIRLLAISFLIASLFFSIFASANNFTNPTAGKGNKPAQTTASSLYGRFRIPSAAIDVALYNDSSQATIDAVDSACFYYFKGNLGMTIADHASQAFRTLPTVQIGDTATIALNDGGIIYLTCVDAYNGRNNGRSLTDANGNIATSLHDYLTYTCISNSGDIRICQWDITGAVSVSSSYDKSFNIDQRTKQRVAEFAAASRTTQSQTETQTGSQATKKNKGNSGKGKNK